MVSFSNKTLSLLLISLTTPCSRPLPQTLTLLPLTSFLLTFFPSATTFPQPILAPLIRTALALLRTPPQTFAPPFIRLPSILEKTFLVSADIPSSLLSPEVSLLSLLPLLLLLSFEAVVFSLETALSSSLFDSSLKFPLSITLSSIISIPSATDVCVVSLSLAFFFFQSLSLHLIQ